MRKFLAAGQWNRTANPQGQRCPAILAASRMATVILLSGLIPSGGCENRTPQIAPTEPTTVTVSRPIVRQVTDYVEYTGRVEAVNAVDIRARVTGYLVQTPFKEGDEVAKGALLFMIDPRPYQAMVLQAQGAYQTNEAKVKLAQANYRRAKNLAKTPNAISQQDLDTYAASEEQASADLITAKANLETAQLNLEFCRVVGAGGRPGKPLLSDRRQPGSAGSNATDHARLAGSRVRLLRHGRTHGARRATAGQ